jgi:hypothetical protein
MKHNGLRRKILKSLVYAGGGTMLPTVSPSIFGQESYNGKFVITLQLEGGADTTSFADPKVNVAGEREINHWSNDAEPMQAGNLIYAPFADNSTFFDKYFQDIMVINGVDAQTNSHSVGVVNNWSGRNSEGFPTITSLFAATMAPELPLAYLNFGGFGATQGVIRSTRISDPNQLRTLIAPNDVESNDNVNYLIPDDWARVQAMHESRLASKLSDSSSMAGNLDNREAFLDAITKTDEISVLDEFIPSANDIRELRSNGDFFSNLEQQMQIAVVAFKAGVAVTADLVEGGFDTHNDHDAQHEVLFSNLAASIDYLWTYAEEQGIADRLVLIIGSDFGRTPRYNANDGKDHWPIGSTLVMEQNVSYTNQMFGETDEGHNALAINPDSLERDDDNGVIIKPAHVHKALRNYLGLADNPITQDFVFNNTEDFDFFG